MTTGKLLFSPEPRPCEDCGQLNGWGRTAWRKVLCRDCHDKRWKNAGKN